MNTARLAILISIIGTLLPFGAQAESPPNLPLPPCEEVDGVRTGACPLTNENLSGDGGTQVLTSGGTISLKTSPTLPVCDEHIGFAPFNWSPGPCYSAVDSPRVIGCGYIDLLDDNKFKETSCSNAFYEGGARAEFSIGPGGRGCGGAGAYGTYVYGGAANIPGQRWVERGPATRFCDITLDSARPNSLKGPTWVKFRIGIDRAENGDERRGFGEYADVFVPVDGDLDIDGVDVSVWTDAFITEENWDAGRLIATYAIRATNIGDEDAENVFMTAGFPTDLTVVEAVSDTENCLLPGISIPDFRPGDSARLPKGGSVKCDWGTLAPGEFKRVEITTRIINATDFDALQSGVTLKKFDQANRTVAKGIKVQVTATDDINTDNNEDLVKVDIPFRSGTYEQTESLMLALAPHFDYYTDNLFEQCNVYMADIFQRLESIHASNPEVFANLSYGNVTSGQYAITGTFGLIESQGHVGVVVYPKGTNYRETGIIIHGTPTQSPLNFNSQLGPDDAFQAGLVSSSTSLGGFYYRTRADGFPGFPQYESSDGFEGEYPDNGSELTYGGAAPAALELNFGTAQCTAPPNAVVVKSESPIDLKITNPDGAIVETSGDEIITQTLNSGISSMAFEHDDGTFGWVIVLPEDDYDVDIMGYAEGSYTLTMTQYDDEGNAEDTVVTGTTEDGMEESFQVMAASDELRAQRAAQSSSSGGGSIGLKELLILTSMLLCLSVIRRRTSAQSRN